MFGSFFGTAFVGNYFGGGTIFVPPTIDFLPWRGFLGENVGTMMR